MNVRKTARRLGWFSIGLGLAEIVAPKMVSRVAHTQNRPGTLRMFGLREIATGVSILTRRRKAPWLWARVAGDAMDLAALGTGFVKQKGKKGRAALALAAVAGVTALDVICGRSLRERHG